MGLIDRALQEIRRLPARVRGSTSSTRVALVRLLPSINLPLTIALAVLVAIAAALPVLQIFTSSALIASVPGAARDGLHSHAGRQLLTYLVATGAVLVVSQAISSIRWTVAATLGSRVGLRLRERVMEAVARPIGVPHLEDPRILDLVSGAAGLGTGRYPVDDAVGGLADSVAGRLGALFSVLLIARFRWWGAILIVAGQMLARRTKIKFASQRTSVLFERGQELRRSDYYRDLALTAGAAKETRVFGLGDWVTERFHQSWLDVMRSMWRRRFGLWPKMLAVDSFLFLGYLVNLLSVAFAARSGEIGLRGVAILIQAIFATSAIVQDAGSIGLIFSLAPLTPLLRLEKQIGAIPRVSGSRRADGLPANEIRFEGVRFRYPGLEHDVLDGLDLTIPAGRSIAIVGLNGAGKTTLVKLLARLHDPDSGRITADGIDLSELDPACWRAQIGVIFQDFVHYHLPAAENVGFGALRLDGDRGALERAAAKAGATEVIDALPRGWDTVLSRQFEGGAELSGGQWQRIALARAMFAVEAGAKVLVMDEPTANLDVRAEADFFDRFLDISRGLTTIVISHRFSTVRRADEICVLDGGVVAERGTHGELLAAQGRYARMFMLQASLFEDQAADA